MIDSTRDLEKAMLSVREACQVLSVSDDLLRRLIAEGQVPARQLGGKWLIPRQWVDEFVLGAKAIPIWQRDAP